jgi:hypothetical protein
MVSMCQWALVRKVTEFFRINDPRIEPNILGRALN